MGGLNLTPGIYMGELVLAPCNADSNVFSTHFHAVWQRILSEGNIKVYELP